MWIFYSPERAMFAMKQVMIPIKWNTGRECGAHQLGGNCFGTLCWVCCKPSGGWCLLVMTPVIVVSTEIGLLMIQVVARLGRSRPTGVPLEAGFLEQKMAFSMHSGGQRPHRRFRCEYVGFAVNSRR